MRFLGGTDFQGDQAFANAQVAYLREVFEQDIFACGEQSRTDFSLANRGSLLGDAECRIAHFYNVLDDELGIATRGRSPWVG